MTQQDENKNDWISTIDAAARLRVDKRVIYRQIARGHVRAYRVGRHYRVALTDIERLACPVLPGTAVGGVQ